MRFTTAGIKYGDMHSGTPYWDTGTPYYKNFNRVYKFMFGINLLFQSGFRNCFLSMCIFKLNTIKVYEIHQ